MNVSLPLTATDRFAWIIRELHAAVAARIRFPPVTGTIIVYICAQLRRIAAEFLAVAEQIRAGTYVQRPRTERRCVARRSSRPGPVRTHYDLGLPPWRAGWLHRVAPNSAGVWAGALRDLFSEPEMAALIAATPRMRRILRPLFFMLGLEASLLKAEAPAVPATPVVADPPAPAPSNVAAARAAVVSDDPGVVALPPDFLLDEAIFGGV